MLIRQFVNRNRGRISSNRPKKVAASVLLKNLGWTNTENPRMTDVDFLTTDVRNMTFYKAVIFATAAGHWAVGINHNRNIGNIPDNAGALVKGTNYSGGHPADAPNILIIGSAKEDNRLALYIQAQRRHNFSLEWLLMELGVEYQDTSDFLHKEGIELLSQSGKGTNAIRFYIEPDNADAHEPVFSSEQAAKVRKSNIDEGAKACIALFL